MFFGILPPAHQNSVSPHVFVSTSLPSSAMSYELKKDKAGQFTFNLKARNGQVILTSQSYSTKAAAQDGIASVRTNGKDDANFESKTSSASEPYFVLKAKNGQVIGRSQMYSSMTSKDGGISSVKASCESPDVTDLTVE